MKHYAYPIFSDTLMSFVRRYMAKYGADDTVREQMMTTQYASTENLIGVNLGQGQVFFKGDFQVNRPTVKKGEVRHEDVVINGWASSSKGMLSKVNPWDLLIPIGHGIEFQDPITKLATGINVNTCTSDDGKRKCTVNDLVDRFEAGSQNLDKDHVVIKLAMCYGGGGGETAPSDCFAKGLATALHAKGWSTILVGGYRGALLSGGGSSSSMGSSKMPFKCTKCQKNMVAYESDIGKKMKCTCGYYNHVSDMGAAAWHTTYSSITYTPNTSKVQHLNSTQKLGAKENLIYFKGDGSIVPAEQVRSAKSILRNFPGDETKAKQQDWVKNARSTLESNLPEALVGFPSEVLVMLEKRLGVAKVTATPVFNPAKVETKPVQGKPQTQSKPSTQTQTQTQTQPQTQTSSWAKRCPNCDKNWNPSTVKGWTCPDCKKPLTKV